MRVNIRNMPEGAMGRYVVATLVDGELWFYGAYETKERAEAARKEYADFRIILRRDEECESG